MKIIEYLNETFEQVSKAHGIDVIQSKKITDGFETAICHYFSKKGTDEKKLCYEKIKICERGFKSICYITDKEIADFLLVTADKNTIYFDITANKKLTEDAKKYLDYRWDTRIDPNEIDINDLFGETIKDNINKVNSPRIQDYFTKELTKLSSMWIDTHHKFMQIEDKIYIKIDVGGDEDDLRYDANNPYQNQKMIEYIKKVLDCIGIEEIEYVIINRHKKYFLF